MALLSCTENNFNHQGTVYLNKTFICFWQNNSLAHNIATTTEQVSEKSNTIVIYNLVGISISAICVGAFIAVTLRRKGKPTVKETGAYNQGIFVPILQIIIHLEAYKYSTVSRGTWTYCQCRVLVFLLISPQVSRPS